MNIIVEEVGPNRFSAVLDGKLLCRSRTPLLSAARVLLKGGADPKAVLTMSREDGVVSMRTTVGEAAALTVREDDDGKKPPRFAPYRSFDAGMVHKTGGQIA